MDTLGIVATVKAPTSQLKLFVNYHLNIGVDYIILFFDDSEDEGVNAFSDYSQVQAICCSVEYWKNRTGARPKTLVERQLVNVNQGAEYLASKECEWLVHIDSDELLNPVKPLKQAISQYDTDVVRFSLLEAVSEQKNYEHIFLPTLFKKESRRIILKFIGKLGFLEALFNGEYLRGHTMSKTAVRILPKFKGKYSVHGPEELPNTTFVNSKLIQLLHFDCVSFEEWQSKWDDRANSVVVGIHMRDNRRKQLELYKNAKKDGEEALVTLFNRMHNVRPVERPILYFLRMLMRLKLDQSLFDSPLQK